jgi:spore germination protein YaaH
MEQSAAQRFVLARRVLASALSAAALVMVTSGCRQALAAKPGPPPRVFAFLSRSGGSELAHLLLYGSRISVVAPNWYELQLNNLTLLGAPSQPIVDAARVSNAQLWPVVNVHLEPTDPIASPYARARVANALAVEAAKRGYAGLTLDVEPLPASHTRAFSALVCRVAARLHAQHGQLAVYVPRRTQDGGDRSYDWPTLVRCADLLIAAGYNEHSATSTPGPVTTAAGFGQMLDYAASVSRWRVAPIIGAFGYSWPETGGQGVLLSTVDAERMREAAHARLRGGGGDAYFSASGRVVHYQTAAGLIARARDARDIGMRWLALFSLGREPDSFWSHIKTIRQGVTRP